MVNISFFSNNEDFKDDLISQIRRFVEGAVLETENPDIIIIDENKDLYSQKRKEYPAVPILLLSSNSQLNDDNLNISVYKPISLMNFLDIVRAVNNKLDNSTEGFLTFNDYELRPNQKEIIDSASGEAVKLTEKEVNILKYLYKMKDDYVSKVDLQTNVWKYNENVTTHTVETHIYRLRQKAERGERRLIITENGKYRLNMG